MNTIKRHYPFERYPSITKEEDFIDLEGAKERTKVEETDKKKGTKLGMSRSNKNVAKKLIYNEDMWIIR